jgi:hypothetical protein
VTIGDVLEEPRPAARRKTDEQAAQWAARRLQDGTAPARILQELEQDGVPAVEAEAIFTSVDAAAQRHFRRGPGRLLLVVGEAFVPATALAFLWEHQNPLGDVEALERMLPAGTYGIGFGLALSGVVALAAGGRRGFAVRAIGCAASVYAIGLGVYLTPVSEGYKLSAFAANMAFFTSGFFLTRRKPRYELVVRGRGRYRWRRVPPPRYELQEIESEDTIDGM